MVVNSAEAMSVVAGELTALIGSFLFASGLLVSEWLGEDFELDNGEGALVVSFDVSLEELVPTPRVTGDAIKKSSDIPNRSVVCDEEPNKAGGTR